MGVRSVLVVDDDEELVVSIRAALERDGIDVRSARNAVQALALVQSSRPDVVLVDLMMPVAGGWDFIQRLRSGAGPSDLPIVLISAMHTLADEAKRLGVTRFLQKPFSLDALVGAVRDAADEGHAPLRRNAS